MRQQLETIRARHHRPLSDPLLPPLCPTLRAPSGATVVLGDRLYGVTIQRVFDALGWREKIKMVAILLWEGT